MRQIDKLYLSLIFSNKCLDLCSIYITMYIWNTSDYV